MKTEASKSWIRALELTARIAQNPSVTFPDLLEQLANRFAENPALEGDGARLNYTDLLKRVRLYTQWAQAQRLGPGDVVCLLMENSPDYLATWLGISRTGAIAALINTDLREGSLLHSIRLASPRHIIVSGKLYRSIAQVRRELDSRIGIWTHGEPVDGERWIDQDLFEREALPPLPPLSLRDPALYIYTSGTTGLPKAARVSHFRIMQWSNWFAGLTGIEPADRMYNCLPMYHSVGGIVATCAPLIGGASVVVRPQFSASQFWKDVSESNCTLFQYIGELCRYLVNSPSHPLETQHRLRLCCGNGLSAGTWEAFQERFRIPRIVEFYAATESPLSLYNCDGKPGAIGRIPAFLAHRFPIELVKFDVETGQPVRGTDGFCLRAETGEPGYAISRMETETGGFEGYTDRAATEQKILRNVFAANDAWFLSGDAMRKDAAGYYYFVDRIGDTFRWKGENVSTAEVADTIGSCNGIVEAVVYGVTVPHTEGRAGMAAIIAKSKLELAELHRTLTERLPAYARPLFLRVRSEGQMTGTFKPQKHQLKKEGFDPSRISDPVFFNSGSGFIPLDFDLYEQIQVGSIRL